MEEKIMSYFFIELLSNGSIINTYSIPEDTFTISNQNDLLLLLNDFFNSMVNDLTFSTKLVDSVLWDSVNFYKLINDVKSSEIIKTNVEMEQYPSYGEGILTIYNTINQ